MVLVFGVAVFFCFFSYRLIELPGMKLSERLRQQMLLKRALSRTNQEDQPVKKAEMVEAATKQG